MRLFIVIQRVTANDPVQAIKVTYFCNLNVCNYKWYIYFQVLMLAKVHEHELQYNNYVNGWYMTVIWQQY